MEYISAEELLKQPVEVQKALLEWWKPNESKTDLVCLFLHDGNEIRLNSAKIQQCNLNPISEIIPMLVEGQLRQFIEDKTGYKILTNYNYEGEITIALKDIKSYGFIKEYGTNETDLLQAYWKVAIEIAKEQTHE